MADGVLVPPELCGPLRRLAVLGAAALMRRDGELPLHRGLVSLLAELDMSARGRPPAVITVAGDSWLTAAEASGLMRLTCRQVRRLASDGRLIARRHGRSWLIDQASATDYRKDRDCA